MCLMGFLRWEAIWRRGEESAGCAPISRKRVDFESISWSFKRLHTAEENRTGDSRLRLQYSASISDRPRAWLVTVEYMGISLEIVLGVI